MDGSMADMDIAASADGKGLKINMENVTLKSLGLEGYNVTGKFDIGVIDAAMEKISTQGAAQEQAPMLWNMLTIIIKELPLILWHPEAA